ncbi:HNH endonuclease [Ectopseudomonas hydrolytica]|uniref:HNH endonuclease n=1 Tax=Ectopseudomonas hydrolytica TaxID=2493633 RepID=A0ABY5ABL2_9GAMM|nr:HNH endonuclease signature motif containing protein [Pseudomonas hydrolytica]USR41215.1 HNH endonuclease [Pseudomonas hydrolytica]
MPISWESVVDHFDRLAKDLHWSRDAFSEFRKRYLANSKTQLSLYGSDVDTSGTIEVGLAVQNLELSTGRELEEVKVWIYGLQTTVGRYAKPKTNYKYPRVAISTESEIICLVEAVRAFITNKRKEAITDVLSPADAKLIQQIWDRRGQQKFRQELLHLYEKKCAITGCTTVAVLEAAHITPYADEQHYDVQRGLLLRADVHTLFDLAVISIDPCTRKVVVSPDAKDDYGYLQGKSVAQPLEASAIPKKKDLESHFNRWNQNIDLKAGG